MGHLQYPLRSEIRHLSVTDRQKANTALYKHLFFYFRRRTPINNSTRQGSFLLKVTAKYDIVSRNNSF